NLRLIGTTRDKLDKAVELIDANLARELWLAAGRDRKFFAVGSTWLALARLHMEATSYPLRVMQGYAIPTREAIAFCETFRKAKRLAALAGIDEVTRARREVLPYGALVMERLLKRMQPSEIVFSVFGIREGLIYSLLTPYERRKDPLLSFCEDHARMRSRSLEHAHELCDWTDALFVDSGLKET